MISSCFTAYTDGACKQNSSWVGGWALVIVSENNEIVRKISGRVENTTNSRMEIEAVLEVIKFLKDQNQINIVSDSSYVVNTINGWLEKWVSEGSYFNKANRDLWDKYLELSKGKKIVATHVRGHSGVYFNEIADNLAVNAIRGNCVNE